MTLKFSSNSKKDSGNQLVTIVVSVVLAVAFSYVLNSKLLGSQKATIQDDQILKYIEGNADKVVEALNNYYKKKAQSDLENRDKLLQSNKKRFESDDSPYIGKKDAKVTVVEFFDYNCGYCKKVFPTLNKVYKDGLDLKIIFIDFPILGAGSEMKARASIAANLIDRSKYLDMHAKLMMIKNNSTVDDLASVAEEIGYNKSSFAKKVNSKEVSDILSENRKLARDLSINGTPAFIIDGKFFQGALSYDVLKKKVLESN